MKRICIFFLLAALSSTALDARKVKGTVHCADAALPGVIVTDGLEMLAAGSEPDGKKALRALQAGCDLLLGLHDIPAVVQTVEDAVASGAISEKELDEHVLRVLRLKLQYGLIEP